MAEEGLEEPTLAAEALPDDFDPFAPKSSDPFRCHVCSEQCAQDNVTYKMGNRQPAHTWCYNAVRAAQTMLKKLSEPLTGEAKKQLLELPRQDPMRWQAIVRSMTSKKEWGRKAEQRQKLRSFVEELASEVRVGRKRRVLLLNQRQYIAYYSHNEGMSPEEATAQWARDEQNPEIYKERDGDKVYMAVLQPTQLEMSVSFAKRRTLKQDEDLETEEQRKAKYSDLTQEDTEGAKMLYDEGGGAVAGLQALQGSGASSCGAELGMKSLFHVVQPPAAPAPAATRNVSRGKVTPERCQDPALGLAHAQARWLRMLCSAQQRCCIRKLAGCSERQSPSRVRWGSACVPASARAAARKCMA